MSRLTCRNGQNSPALSRPSLPLSSRSRMLRFRFRFRENCTPTSRSEMTGSPVCGVTAPGASTGPVTGRVVASAARVSLTSDFLEDGSFEPGEHEYPDGEHAHGPQHRMPKIFPVPHDGRREERGMREFEETDRGVELVDELQVRRQ